MIVGLLPDARALGLGAGEVGVHVLHEDVDHGGYLLRIRLGPGPEGLHARAGKNHACAGSHLSVQNLSIVGMSESGLDLEAEGALHEIDGRSRVFVIEIGDDLRHRVLLLSFSQSLSRAT